MVGCSLSGRPARRFKSSARTRVRFAGLRNAGGGDRLCADRGIDGIVPFWICKLRPCSARLTTTLGCPSGTPISDLAALLRPRRGLLGQRRSLFDLYFQDQFGIKPSILVLVATGITDNPCTSDHVVATVMYVTVQPYLWLSTVDDVSEIRGIGRFQ